MSDLIVRALAVLIGLAVAAGGLTTSSTIGPAFSRGAEGHRPLTRGQRAVLLAFGCALVVGGVLG